MVNYKYTDQLATTEPLFGNDQLCGKEFTNKLTN